MATRNITSKEFESEVTGGQGLAVIDFTATWCGPCQALAPSIDQMSQDYDGRVLIAKVDVDQEQELASRHGVMSVPTVLFFKDGQKVDQVQGNFPDRIKSKIEEHLQTATG